jgi:ubiquinone/menaquinone biosynthesis C-methylase UbiE
VRNGKTGDWIFPDCGGGGLVIGMDISDELIQEVKECVKREGLQNIKVCVGDANNPLPFEDNVFDIVSCCFSMYYYNDIPKVLSEIYRVLKPDGKLFVAAPTKNNISELVSLYPFEHLYITRTENEVIPAFFKQFGFKYVDIVIFRNPVVFPDYQSFLNYFSSTKIYKEIPEKGLNMIKDAVMLCIKNDGGFTITKEVYGITGIKIKKS